jgi:putative transposase
MSRQAYYQYKTKAISSRELENEAIADTILMIYHEFNGILGYRMMQLYVNRRMGKQYNHKRIYRLMRLLGLKSVTRVKKKFYVKSTPQHVAENLLNREFTANKKNQKWLTDVTEFQYNGGKAYLSAILDLHDNSIVSFVIGKNNNNTLVFQTLKLAIERNPKAQPMIHSDRGFQYTSYGFSRMLALQGMTQSMSRVGRCLDNAPMEGFWGKVKSEKYYLKKGYSTYEELVHDIETYLEFYNNARLQRKLNNLAPMEYRALAS